MENPITSLIHLYATRYVTIAGTAVLVYDTVLSFPDEVRLVWATIFRSKYAYSSPLSSWVKILYLGARYSMIVVCIVTLIMALPLVELSNKWSDTRCSNATVFTGALDIILESIASGAVFYRLYKLWNLKSRKKWALVAVFLIGKGIVWTFTFINMARIDHTISYISIGNIIRVCATMDTPRLALGVWIPEALLDVSLILFFLLNALSKPRLESEHLMKIVWQDGIQFFLTMVSMRIINVVFTAFAPASLFFIGTIFSGAMVTTVSSRVFLSLFKSALDEGEEGDTLFDSRKGGVLGSEEEMETFSCENRALSRCTNENFSLW